MENSINVVLCLNQQDFNTYLDMLGLLAHTEEPYLLPGAYATGHLYTDTPQGPVYLICFNTYASLTPIEAACILVHEAVHVWQAHCEFIGEDNPGVEVEAYAIQAISKQLMLSYDAQINCN